MNGKIDESGLLLIERRGVYKPQYCPLSNPGTECGDWCPMFDEIYMTLWLHCAPGQGAGSINIVEDLRPTEPKEKPKDKSENTEIICPQCNGSKRMPYNQLPWASPGAPSDIYWARVGCDRCDETGTVSGLRPGEEPGKAPPACDHEMRFHTGLGMRFCCLCNRTEAEIEGDNE